MTSLLVWYAADKKKVAGFRPASVYIATDSLITWKDESKWPHGKKVFAAKSSPDIFAYCGDRLFAAHVLGQVVAAIDSGYLFAYGESAAERMSKVQQTLRMLWKTYPEAQQDDTHIVHVTRDGEGVDCRFLVQKHHFQPRKLPHSGLVIEAPSGQVSAPLLMLGSGSKVVRSHIEEWNRQYENRHTSRSIFSAFCESLESGIDENTGGAPQLVGLYRVEAGRSFGVIWKNDRYFDGLRTLPTANKDGVAWRNNTFEIADQTTKRRAAGAAVHHRKYDFIQQKAVE